MRDSPKVSYIENQLSFSSLLKKRGALTYHGGGKIEKRKPWCPCLFFEVVHQVIFEPSTCHCAFVIQLGDPFPLSHSILMTIYPFTIGCLSSQHLRILCPSLCQCCQVNFLSCLLVRRLSA